MRAAARANLPVSASDKKADRGRKEKQYRQHDTVKAIHSKERSKSAAKASASSSHG